MAEENNLTLETASPCVGTTFRLDRPPDAPVELTLVEVKDLGPAPGPDLLGKPGLRDKAFALTLRGPRTPLLPQRIYTMTHATLGALAIFIVPIGPDGSGMRYEAIFN